MKEMIKKVREDRGGFTLAELLIVVAIIAVLVAIAVPVFSGSMDSANEAVAVADIRSAKSEGVTKALEEGKATGTYVFKINSTGDVSLAPDGTTPQADLAAAKAAVAAKQDVIVKVEVKQDPTTKEYSVTTTPTLVNTGSGEEGDGK